MSVKPIAVEEREFESKSSPGVFYSTIVRSDGMVACNCRGWTVKKKDKPRRCAHTDIIVAGRRTVDDGTYLYIASMAPRVAAYRAAKAKQQAPGALPVTKLMRRTLLRCSFADRPTVARIPIPTPEPPQVIPPVLPPPGRRRIVFTDEMK